MSRRTNSIIYIGTFLCVGRMSESRAASASLQVFPTGTSSRLDDSRESCLSEYPVNLTSPPFFSPNQLRKYSARNNNTKFLPSKTFIPNHSPHEGNPCIWYAHESKCQTKSDILYFIQSVTVLGSNFSAQLVKNMALVETGTLHFACARCCYSKICIVAGVVLIDHQNSYEICLGSIMISYPKYKYFQRSWTGYWVFKCTSPNV